MSNRFRLIMTGAAAAAVTIVGCAKDSKPAGGKVATTQPVSTSLKIKNSPTVQPAVGFQQRSGDEIVVAGQFYRIGTPVVTWMDPGGFDAYRVERRFAPVDQAGWQPTTQAMAAGKIKFVSSNQQFAPARYSTRTGGATTQPMSAYDAERIARGGWTLPELQDRVDQFVLHYDVSGTSAQCFKVLHDLRGLSVQFMLDIDGTIYQTLDLKESAWHGGPANNRSIGIEIANMGSYSTGENAANLERWYKKDADGKTYIAVPESLGGENGTRVPGIYRPIRNDLVVGEIRGNKQRMYDLTPQQYAALVKLTAALSDVFPKIKLDYPRDEKGGVLWRTLTDDEFNAYEGVLGHYHVSKQKSDPGVAFQWDYLIDNARKLRDGRGSATASK